jgi:energy-coupling factor transport system permease protein
VKRRLLHPLAWWCWALALGAAALRTTNALLLGLLIAVAWIVVAARRQNAPWARSFTSFLRLGVFVIVLRMLLQILFGQRLPGHVLFTVPEIDLPSWAAGTSLGGPVTREALVLSFQQGLQLATLLACVGAANSLASPYRLLRSLPSVLYELGVVVTVALCFAPQATLSAQRVRDARRLRGRPHRGLRGMRGLAVPVLEGGLEQSLDLAASMDSRGYGRRGSAPIARRRLSQITTLIGVLLLAIGVFGALDSGAPVVLGIPALVCGSALLALSLVLARSGTTRSRYRTDPWRMPEWTTVTAGLVALAALVIAGHIGVDLKPAYSTPTLPLLPALGVLCATIPSFATPPLPVELA